MEILFEKGIPGFENYRYFNVNIVEGIKRFYHIVSKEDSNIGFISISPFDIKKDYEIDLDDEFIKELDIKDEKDVLVICLITLGKSLKDSTANLKAPKEKVILRKEVYEKVKNENSNAIVTSECLLNILK